MFLSLKKLPRVGDVAEGCGRRTGGTWQGAGTYHVCHVDRGRVKVVNPNHLQSLNNVERDKYTLENK